MTRTTLAHTLAATLLVGTLAAAVHTTPAPVDAAKKRAPTATATKVPTATTTSVPAATPTITPTNTPVPFTVTAWVSPSSMPSNYYPTLYAYARPGATCSASVVYNDGSTPTSFSGTTQTVPASAAAVVGWTWLEETTSTGGTGTVTCTYGGQTASASATFTVY